MSSSPYEISVIISTYDDRDLVSKKLAEIQAQSAFEHCEFIFIEPCSPGNERELLQPFCDQHQNCRLIKLESRITLYEAWNLGWQEAQSPFVCVSNMDDTMHPELLNRILVDSKQHDWEVASVLIAKQSMDELTDDWSHSRLAKLELSTRPGPFFVWRRSLKESLGLFDTKYDYAGDKDFWARVMHAGIKSRLIPQILYLYTKHPAQLSKIQEFKAKRKADDMRGESQVAPYIWPAYYTRKVRWIRFLRRLPFIGRRYIDQM